MAVISFEKVRPPVTLDSSAIPGDHISDVLNTSIILMTISMRSV